jgi:WD40 repeat protein
MHPSARTYTSLVSAVNAPLFTEISDQSSHVEDSERHPDHARAAADSRRRLLAIIGEDSLVRLWDTRDFRHPKRVGRSVPGTAMALSPDGSLLAVEGDDFKAHSPEGSLLDLNRVPQVISLWDTSDPRHLTQLVTIRSPDLAGNRMAFSPDGHLLAVGGPPVYLWDVRDRRNPARVGRSLPGDLPAFSPRQHVLATADTGTESGTVQLWDTSRPSHLKELSGFDHGSLETKDLVFSPDGQTLATNGADGGQLRLWDTRNPKRPTVFDAPLRTADGSEVTTVAFSLDGRIVAVAGTNGIQLWNIGNRLEPQRLGGPLGQPSHAGIALIFGADDRDLITDDRVIRVWKLPPLLPLGCLGPSVVGFSLDKQTLVTACDDPGRIHIWSTSSSGESEHLSSVPGRIAAVASNGRLLAVVDPGDRIRLWDVTDPAHPRRLGRIPEPGGDAIACLALSGDGRTLA